MSLEDDLQEIRGIGEAKASEIMTVFENHQSDTPDVVKENLEQAIDYYEDGQYSYAGKFLRQAYEGFE